MEGANIVFIEDNDCLRKSCRELLEGFYGHVVVAEATSCIEAQMVIDRLESGELSADVVLLDNELTDGPQAANIVEAIRAALSHPPVIFGFSGMPMHRVDVDVDVGKNLSEVVRLITEMPERVVS